MEGKLYARPVCALTPARYLHIMLEFYLGPLSELPPGSNLHFLHARCALYVHSLRQQDYGYLFINFVPKYCSGDLGPLFAVLCWTQQLLGGNLSLEVVWAAVL